MTRFSILTVDDNKLASLALSIVLRNAGFDAFYTSSGKMALSDLKIQAFDLLIVDLQMPDMDGFTLLKHIKSEAPYGELRVLTLTGSDDALDVARARRLGACGFLSKPFDDHALVQKTHRILTSTQIAWIDDYHCLLRPLAQAPSPAIYA